MLMVDRIVDINTTGGKDGKGRVLAELDIHPLMVRPAVKGVVAADALVVLR